MISFLHRLTTRRFILLALPLAIFLTLFFPAVASAHAILLRSDPVADSQLNVAPQQVRMWFSEALNPAFSTAVVINEKNKRVDNQDAHVSPNDPTEMDLTLQSNLPPAVYIVIYRTDSAVDGHILRGSFIFSVGTAPTLSPGANPGANVLGGNLTGLSSGQLDGPTIFNLIMVTLVELGAVFWVGAQLWANFVLSFSAEAHAEEKPINEGVQHVSSGVFRFLPWSYSCSRMSACWWGKRSILQVAIWDQLYHLLYSESWLPAGVSAHTG